MAEVILLRAEVVLIALMVAVVIFRLVAPMAWRNKLTQVLHRYDQSRHPF